MKRTLGVLVLIATLAASTARAQAPTAVLNGQVRDTSGGAIKGATVDVINVATKIHYTTRTNDEGIYSVPNLPPGTYRVQVSKDGFKTIVHPDVTLNVQDALAIGFTLSIGATSETVTVEGGTPIVDTESGAVDTLVDRNFIESIPLNGRSLQPLIALTPGVVLTPASPQEQGQFSVNGQRANANYFIVDGVSANFGSSVGQFVGQAASGSVPGLNVSGGTNNLVSIDSIQEFRVETSSYAPEFGRQPGGQISIATRSGTNQFHGDLFDYFRNTVFDANDWFNDQVDLPKSAEHQNDFGGTLGGPIVKDRTFFFFSYEGLRLLQPGTGEETVPTVAFRQSSAASLQPLLNAFPIPNGQDFGSGDAQFIGTFSSPTTLNATSIRADYKLTKDITLFARYNYAPSKSSQRNVTVPNMIVEASFPIQTLTLASTQVISQSTSNDFRFNYSRSDMKSFDILDNFGGAVPPPDSLLFPAPYSSRNAQFVFEIFTGGSGYTDGSNGANSQRQFDVVDTVALSRGRHQFKFGVDYRRLRPTNRPANYFQYVDFFGLTGSGGIDSGTVPILEVGAADTIGLVFQNLSLYAQDTWKLGPRLTLTYGLRWELNPAFHGIHGQPIYTVDHLSDPPNIALAPAGTPFYNTTYHDLAPRVGFGVQIGTRKGFETVFRSGFGIFYDLGAGSLANGSAYFPYNRSNVYVFEPIPFPIPASLAAPPPFTTVIPPGGVFQMEAADPNLQLPRTYQWNAAVEQSLGSNQSVAVTYVGALGRDILRQQIYDQPNSSFTELQVTNNTGRSNYNALQVQYQRRLSAGIQALGFYSWSHCIDNASNDSSFFGNNPALDRGNCDFDIRHSFRGVVTYTMPALHMASVWKAILGGWSVDAIGVAQSAPPVDLNTGLNLQSATERITVRPDVTSGVPLYLYGSQYPGGKAINNTIGAVTGGCPGGTESVGPFCPPPIDSSGNPLRQGNLGRNALRGFGLGQLDFALRRQFDLTERWNLEFSAEAFNVLNHPNFGNVDTCTCDAPGTFGEARQMQNNALSSFGGGFNPLYQVGGPRSVQLALKLRF